MRVGPSTARGARIGFGLVALQGWVEMQRKTVPAVVIGRRIAHARTRLGLTQQKLADDASLPASSLAQYETGRCLPSAERQSSLALLLQVPQEVLFAGAVRRDDLAGGVTHNWTVEASESEMWLLSRIQSLPNGFQDIALSMIEVAARLLVEREKVPVQLEG